MNDVLSLFPCQPYPLQSHSGYNSETSDSVTGHEGEGSQDSEWLWAGQLSDWSSSPCTFKIFLFCTHLHQFCGPPGLLSNAYLKLFPQERPEGKRPLGKSRYRLQDNIKMYLGERMGWHELD
jgi:hypothetical protein